MKPQTEYPLTNLNGYLIWKCNFLLHRSTVDKYMIGNLQMYVEIGPFKCVYFVTK